VPDPGVWQGRRVWLTGHTGFKGAWLALWLELLGAEVYGFSSGRVSDPSLYAVADVARGLEGEVRGDVRSKSEVRAAVSRAQPDVVIHMAAQALVRRGLSKPVESFTVNVTGTAKVLEALRVEASPRAVLVVTSDKCYRNAGRALREDDPLGGDDPYSASKAGQEHVASAFRALGVPIATVRAGNVIGGGDWAADRLLADCMRAALAGEPVTIRAPESVRPWQHVLCALDGYLLVAEALLAGTPGAASPWNFGPDDEHPVGRVVDALAERWPGGLDVRASEPGAAAGEAPALRLDSTRSRDELGWVPRWDLDAALDAIVAWYAAYRDGADMRAETLRQIAAYAERA
jgi:CDP-glucose 4,6-dehydratase